MKSVLFSCRCVGIAFLAACVLTSFSVKAEDVFPLERGVGYELAQERSRTLSDIEYDLTFTVPEKRTQSIKGEARISFNLSEKRDVVLDFAGADAEGNIPCRVNGRQRQLSYGNGHITVPVRFLKTGRNQLSLSFTSSDKALNRNDDYMYTLFVPGNAHSAFPCFDQPDMKARFRLTLITPEAWLAQTNAPENTTNNPTQVHRYEETDPLPTYLFAFTTGIFQRTEKTIGSHTIELLYRETDEKKLSQVPSVMEQIAKCVEWMEHYTGIRHPFKKLGYVVLPNYQFGGMEHPGCVQLTDRRIFLNPTAGITEELSRYNLIAHETAHLWFGDMVTMKWFDDVWTKEVFANFMADKMCIEQFPDVNHTLNFLKNHYPPAMRTDRTDGTHPIQQPLDNLERAGLLYGNIIYHKAPIMMQKLEERMGAGQFRTGLQRYLQQYRYGNATWDDLISILDSVSPEAHLPAFSHVWVKEKGMPMIKATATQPIEVRQTDVFHRNLAWPQNLKMLCTYQSPGNAAPTTADTLNIYIDKPLTMCPAKATPTALIPNADGACYARFALDDPATDFLLEQGNDVERYASLLRLHDNFLQKLGLDGAEERASRWAERLNKALQGEHNTLVAAQMCSYLCSLLGELDTSGRSGMEQQLWNISETHPLIDIRRQARVYLSQHATAPALLQKVYNAWQNESDTLLSKRQYTQVAYHLAVMMPEQWQDILATQRARITNTDQLNAFDYVARACNPDAEVRKKLFVSMLNLENRRVETWTLQMLSVLNSEPYRQDAVEYISPGLAVLQELQQTGSIFYPANWLSQLLAPHKSIEACRAVEEFISTRTNYPETLMNKLKEASYTLRMRWQQH